MRLNVHLASILILIQADAGRENVLDGFSPGGDARHTELEVSSLHWLGPLVTSFVALGEGLPDVRGVLALLDVVELVSETLQILSSDDLLDVVRAVGLLAEALPLGDRNLVVYHTRVDLLNTRLVLEALSVTLYVLRSPWGLPFGQLRVQAVLSALVGAQSNDLAGGSYVRHAFQSAR